MACPNQTKTMLVEIVVWLIIHGKFAQCNSIFIHSNTTTASHHLPAICSYVNQALCSPPNKCPPYVSPSHTISQPSSSLHSDGRSAVEGCDQCEQCWQETRSREGGGEAHGQEPQPWPGHRCGWVLCFQYLPKSYLPPVGLQRPCHSSSNMTFQQSIRG